MITATTGVHLPEPVSTDLSIKPDSVLTNPIGKDGVRTKAKEAPSPHEVRLAPLDSNPVFQSLNELDCLPLLKVSDIFETAI